jgi:hypothetical protein
MCGQEILDLGRADDLGHGEAAQDRVIAAGMVLLCMQIDQVVNPVDTRLSQVLHEDLDLLRVDGVDQRRFLAADHQIRVIGGAMGRRHETVEHAALGMSGADFKKAVGNR